MARGNLFVVSGPSGAGKGTIIKRAMTEVKDAWLSVSATTRAPREGEKDGRHYYFMNRDEFFDLVDKGGFLEWAEYAGNCYGTPLESVEAHIAKGEQVFLEIEIQGALQIRQCMPEAHFIFIEPPSFEELERRLVERGTELTDQVKKRLQTAKVELSYKNGYDIVLVNDDLDEATRAFVAFVNQEVEETRG